MVPEILAPVTLPVQAMLPVAPSTVQPVAAEPPARLMDVALTPPGPMFKVVAAPPKLTVVAVVLIKSKLTEPVVIEAAKLGEVPKTRAPDPVSSVTDAARLADEIDVASCPPVVVATSLSGIKPEKVIVPDEVKPVKPVNVPAMVELPVMLAPPVVTVKLAPNVPEPATFKFAVPMPEVRYKEELNVKRSLSESHCNKALGVTEPLSNSKNESSASTVALSEFTLIVSAETLPPVMVPTKFVALTSSA